MIAGSLATSVALISGSWKFKPTEANKPTEINKPTESPSLVVKPFRFTTSGSESMALALLLGFWKFKPTAENKPTERPELGSKSS